MASVRKQVTPERKKVNIAQEVPQWMRKSGVGCVALLLFSLVLMRAASACLWFVFARLKEICRV